MSVGGGGGRVRRPAENAPGQRPSPFGPSRRLPRSFLAGCLTSSGLGGLGRPSRPWLGSSYPPTPKRASLGLSEGAVGRLADEPAATKTERLDVALAEISRNLAV